MAIGERRERQPGYPEFDLAAYRAGLAREAARQREEIRAKSEPQTDFGRRMAKLARREEETPPPWVERHPEGPWQRK